MSETNKILKLLDHIKLDLERCGETSTKDIDKIKDFVKTVKPYKEYYDVTKIVMATSRNPEVRRVMRAIQKPKRKEVFKVAVK